jgi:hypothetical protein
MLLWIILGMGWLGILIAGVSLFRIAGYADKKLRRLVDRPDRTDHPRYRTDRPRYRNDQAA